MLDELIGINKIILISFELIPLDIATFVGSQNAAHRKHEKANEEKKITNTGYSYLHC